MDVHEIERVARLNVYPRSVFNSGSRTFALTTGDKRLCILAPEADARFEGERHSVSSNGTSFVLQICPRSHPNAAALREALPWTGPATLGLTRTVGCGDRLGLATPGHIRAVRKHGLLPILPQQSIREMTRTGRSPLDVMNDAVWGVFEEGWR